jgi:hypothetical protein
MEHTMHTQNDAPTASQGLSSCQLLPAVRIVTALNLLAQL